MNGQGISHDLLMMVVQPCPDLRSELRHVVCPECGRAQDIDWSLVKRGDYFCDGTETYQYRLNRTDRPSISHVFEDQDARRVQRQEMRDMLYYIAAQLTEAATLLQNWVTQYSIDMEEG